MIRRSLRARIEAFVTTTVIVAWVGMLGVASFAAAQRRDVPLDLARLCSHEAGIDVSADECAAMWRVVADRCGGEPRRCARRLFSERTNRPYYARLDRSGEAPGGWPSLASWSRSRAYWLALLETAALIVSGEVVHRCDATPQTWGGECDAERARRLRLVPLACGPTVRNTFYRYPEASR